MKVVLQKFIALALAVAPFAISIFLSCSGSRILDGQFMKTGTSIFILGSLISIVNFYLSFLRYPIHKLTGGTKQNYRFVSGIPFLGLLVLLGMALLPPETYLNIGTIVLLSMDTCGVSWFVMTVWRDNHFWTHNA